MNLGILAAGAIEEIKKGRPPSESPNLKTLVGFIGSEPMYDPITHYYHGSTELRDAALGRCEDLALTEKVVLKN